MSLKDLAQQMKATGRKGDTELVHMTKREVAGLQALAEAAGGTLTKNPKTGLPEASFLESLLPTIIGVGVGMFAGPMAGAAAGAAVGGAQNKDDPLMGALMGGLGGYGGATLGAGLNTAGAASAQAAQGAAAQQAATQASQQAAAQGTQQLAAQQAAQQGAGLMSTGVDAGFVNAMRPDILAQTTPTAYQQAMIQSSPEVIGAGNRAAAAVYDTAAKDFAAQPFMDRASQGIGALGNEGGRMAFMDGVGGLGGLAKSGAMAASPALLGGMMPRGRSSEAPTEEKDEEDLMGRYEYRANPIPGGRPVSSAATGERMYFEPEFRRMFAQGGTLKKQDDVRGMSALSSNVGAREVDGIEALAKGGMKAGGFVVPADIVSFVGEGNTDAGYERIKDMLPGAVPIKGKDGGQADTVKTSIEGKQPARVAHGEMYVPPKTVEGAGGAKKLYAMMDKVRKQATGKKKQIKPVNLKKALA